MRVLALLPVAALLLSCRGGRMANGHVDAALAALAPPDALVLAGINLEQIRATHFYQKLMERSPMPEIDNMAAEIGFDPRKDLRELLIAFDGKQTVLLASGNFALREGKEAGESKYTKSSYKGWTLYSSGDSGFATRDNKTAAAGKLDAVRGAIDRRSASAPTLLDKVAAIPTHDQVWLVSNAIGTLLTPQTPLAGNAANIGRVLRSLDDVVFEADLRNGVAAEASGWCRNAEDARMIEGAVRGLVGLGRLRTPDGQPDVLKIYDAIKVNRTDKIVKVTMVFGNELVDRLVDMLPKPDQRRPRR